jgi:hypothetical protein
MGKIIRRTAVKHLDREAKKHLHHLARIGELMEMPRKKLGARSASSVLSTDILQALRREQI